MAKKKAKKSAKKVAKKAAKKTTAKKTAKKAKSARKPNAAFMKPLMASAALAAVIGVGMFSRTEVVKRMWKYIKKQGLQDPKNKRMIVADDKLKPVFGGKSKVDMFEMTKHISKNLK